MIKSKCHTLAHMQGPVQIREVTSVVGLMVSAFSGVQYAPLFYRSLENDKTNALKCNGSDLEGKMTLFFLPKQDLLWWISNIDQYPEAISPLPPDITLITDSSLKGWGGVIEGTPNVTGGRWSIPGIQIPHKLPGAEGHSISPAVPLQPYAMLPHKIAL